MIWRLPPGGLPGKLPPRGPEAPFREWSAQVLGAAATLHQFRHSVLTHDAEDGAPAPLLMTKSGHSSLRTLGKYARPGTEALSAWQQRTDRTPPGPGLTLAGGRPRDLGVMPEPGPVSERLHALEARGAPVAPLRTLL